MTTPQLKPRERDTIIQALSAGVVPRVGLQHIQVGRSQEIQELIKDLDRIADSGSTIRFIIGEYGSGKTFFLNLIRQLAMQKRMVVFSADISPDRRLHSTGGHARALYAEMAKNTATLTKQEGGALPSIMERFVTEAVGAAERNGDTVSEVIRQKLFQLQDMTGGYDFATVVSRFWEAHDQGDDNMKANTLRWMRGEYTTRTEARKDLGVRTIVDDANLYDQLKLFALFARQAGYHGILITLDEMVNLHKLASSQARQTNYEQILRMLNDILQGSAEHIGIVMSGTPEFLLDTRRGLYSYAALQSRLAENNFARNGLVDLTGPVIRLPNLTQDEMYVLLEKIRAVVQNNGNPIPDEALTAFMAHCSDRIGDAYFRTPRNTVKEFVSLLAVLEQNPGAQWKDLLPEVNPTDDSDPQDAGTASQEDDDELTTFSL